MDDWEHYTLFLSVTLPSTTEVAKRWLKSPRAILDIAYGEALGPDTLKPSWCNMFVVGKDVTFSQPRAIVCALFAKLAMNRENIERVRVFLLGILFV